MRPPDARPLPAALRRQPPAHALVGADPEEARPGAQRRPGTGGHWDMLPPIAPCAEDLTVALCGLGSVTSAVNQGPQEGLACLRVE